ncbi:uncharacterized protein LOC124897223 [Capsicum annuum]|uniref:uncharacterized protein LOC124897223 n=1 Tax=Capsicum annuum TaxID=4072 RepID=UPI001FB17E61|nr:uncharacterized protein LOC124897223 [Capsicum annuum]
MTSHDIHKDIVIACKIETINSIIEDLNGDYFPLLVDESKDVSLKEQMVVCIRYVDKKRLVIEAFIGLVHVKNASTLFLKKVIVDVLAYHSFTLSYVRGQCYYGASNMQGELGETLIRQENRAAHSVHYFARRLQLALVVVSKNLEENASTLDEKASVSEFLGSCQTFETVFLLHLMTDILGITNDLNVSLQKKK